MRGEYHSRVMNRACLLAALTLAIGMTTTAQSPPPHKPRARELGISVLIGGTPGSLDAITDLAGVEVGQTTLIRETGRSSSAKVPFERV